MHNQPTHALIVANGDSHPWPIVEERARLADIIVATDGAGDRCLAHHIYPDVIIGDLDSYKNLFEFNGTLVGEQQQDNTDLDKALNWLHAQSIASVEVWGAWGGRIDHTLKNIGSLIKHNPLFRNLYFHDEHGTLWVCPRKLTLTLPVGTPISLLAPTGPAKGVVSEHLKYPLKGEHLLLGELDGSSNENTAPDFSVSHDEGALLIYVKRHLFD